VTAPAGPRSFTTGRRVIDPSKPIAVTSVLGGLHVDYRQGRVIHDHHAG